MNQHYLTINIITSLDIPVKITVKKSTNSKELALYFDVDFNCVGCEDAFIFKKQPTFIKSNKHSWYFGEILYDAVRAIEQGLRITKVHCEYCCWRKETNVKWEIIQDIFDFKKQYQRELELDTTRHNLKS